MGGGTHKAQVLELVREDRTNERIIEGLERSDPDAARALFDEYGDLVNRMVWRLLGADQEHDDVVHQVFVNILTSIGSVRNPAALKSWITGVTLNTVRREIRTRKYRRILKLVPDPAANAVHAGGTTQLTRSFYTILSGLGTEERIAFTLHHVEGQGLAEVAVTMGRSLATVKRRIAKARKIMMAQIKKDARLASVVEELKHER